MIGENRTHRVPPQAADDDLLPHLELPRLSTPFTVPWPTSGNPVHFLSFHEPLAWRSFVGQLSLAADIPLVVRHKYRRAQKLYLLSWLDLDLIKAGEAAALAALELALRDRYGSTSTRRRGLAPLLKHMVEIDGLADENLPFIARYGGSVIGRLVGDDEPSLADVRNGLAHGDPFGALPVAGLLELVRDLIEFAYRRYLAEATPVTFRQ